MMRALLAKELRSLRPYAIFILGLIFIATIFSCVAKAPDEMPLVPSQWLESDRSGAFPVLMLFGLMIGAGVLMRESEEGTLQFLDGLPISRSQMFVAKVVAAISVMSVIPLVGMASDVGFGWLARVSTDGPFPWRFVAVEAALQIVASIFIVAAAMVMSFLRAWFALGVGLLFWTYLLLQQRGADWVVYFNPYEVLAPALDGDHVTPPWRHIATQLSASVVLFGVAWGGFIALGDRTQFAAQRVGRSRLLRGFGLLLKWAAPVLWILLLVRLFGDSAREEAVRERTPVGEEAFAKWESKRYESLYRKAQGKKAATLMGEADGIHDSVAAFFGSDPPPSRIVVDLASPVIPHALGVTNWTKIRFPFSTTTDLPQQRRVLRHETTHVFIEQLGGGTLSPRFRYIRFFHEGLATHVEYLAANAAEQLALKRSLAAIWSRGKVPFELLCDDEHLGRQRDPFIVYPLGEAFARAVVATGGNDAPTRLLRAFARKDAPMGLAGTALWRDTMQAAGLDYEAAVSKYAGNCASALSDEQAFVDRLPRLEGAVSSDNGRIIIRVTYQGTSPGRLACFVEDRNPFGGRITAVPQQTDGSFALPKSEYPWPKLRYLLGWYVDEAAMPVFEPWKESPL